ncbi:MAG TPA: hypothetical protein VFC19_25335 [Candidatus Limnocylindrales bacterium]|nr:hypothetical protein [Candidatus Limnocylindrales bacterium]
MTVSPDWTPPPPPPPDPGGSGRRPIRPGRVWTGIGIALGGHLLTILIGWLVAILISGEQVLNFLLVATAGQILLAIAALVVGIILTVKGQDGGIGVGLLIGWAVGLIISPVIGFGVCVSLSNSGSGGLFG